MRDQDHRADEILFLVGSDREGSIRSAGGVVGEPRQSLVQDVRRRSSLLAKKACDWGNIVPV
jgi:hypothetical protein